MTIKNSTNENDACAIIDQGRCTLCGLCVEICPSEVLKKEVGQIISVQECSTFGCIGCAQCAMVCPVGCIRVEGRRTSIEKIIPLPGSEARACEEQLHSLLLSRRSIRRFSKKTVTKEQIDKIIKMASTAPMGIPPWEVSVTVFDTPEKVAGLAHDVAQAYKKIIPLMDNKCVALLLKLFAKRSLYDQIKHFIIPLGKEIIESSAKGRDVVCYGAPAAIMFNHSPYCGSEDAMIACTYAMIAAESMGIGNCMIGCIAPLITKNRQLLQKYGLKSDHKPVIVLILGYSRYRFKEAIQRDFHSVHYI